MSGTEPTILTYNNTRRLKRAAAERSFYVWKHRLMHPNPRHTGVMGHYDQIIQVINIDQLVAEPTTATALNKQKKGIVSSSW